MINSRQKPEGQGRVQSLEVLNQVRRGECGSVGVSAEYDPQKCLHVFTDGPNSQ